MMLRRWSRPLGFQWMATDEGILAKSGVDLHGDNRRRLFQPYKRDGITIFFRDRGLSDLIGFQYMHGSASDSAQDLVRRLREMPDGFACLHHSRRRESLGLLPQQRPGFPALSVRRHPQGPGARGRHAFRKRASACRLRNWIGLRLVHGRMRTSRSGWAIPRITRRGDGFVAARAALMEREGQAPQEKWNLAYEELLIAEGSDWMWWFGNDFSSDSDAIFDSLFRQHIGNIYQLIGLPAPEGLDVPIKKSLEGRKLVMAPPPGVRRPFGT